MCKKVLSLSLILLNWGVVNAEAAEEAAKTDGKIRVQGAVISPEGIGVQGIEVRCFYFHQNDMEFQMGSQISGEGGKYEFQLRAGFEYCIEAGREKATYARSKRFRIDDNKEITVENLVVRPFTASVKGRVVFEDGRAAAGLAYGCVSENRGPNDFENPPKTNSEGEFAIEYLLPDELFSFWVFTDANTYRVWKRLDPNNPPKEFVLREDEYTCLPSDWLHGGFTHMAIARDIVYAENSMISFELPDLEGRKVSLGEERFRDKGVIVNITGSWCGGCKLEAPYLVELYKKYRDEGLEIIGLAFEKGGGQDGLEAAKSFRKKYGINYTMLYGGLADVKHVESVIKGLKCFQGYPTTIYIDRKGKVRYMHAGFWINTAPHKKWQLEQIEEHIKMILAEESGDKQAD